MEDSTNLCSGIKTCGQLFNAFERMQSGAASMATLKPAGEKGLQPYTVYFDATLEVLLRQSYTPSYPHRPILEVLHDLSEEDQNINQTASTPIKYDEPITVNIEVKVPGQGKNQTMVQLSINKLYGL